MHLQGWLKVQDILLLLSQGIGSDLCTYVFHEIMRICDSNARWDAGQV